MTRKEKVIAHLVKGGSSEESARAMVEEKYNTVVWIYGEDAPIRLLSNIIRTVEV